MMRRVWRIVNEMEFRMLRAARSFSPSTRAPTTKGFFGFVAIDDHVATPSSAQSPRRSGAARIAFLARARSKERPSGERTQFGRPFH
jgi:hypothetical protein